MSRSDAALTQQFAAFYVARGWPLLVLAAGTKDRPLTRHAVHDATTDLDQIARWLSRWPDLNLGVACGAPGPQVLDLDYPDRAPAAVIAAARTAPRVRSYRTANSGHAYFAGTEAGTIELGYGELRGRGSYAMVPPSIHPSGRPYRWIVEPHGPLQPVPALLRQQGRRGGSGEHAVPTGRVPHGQRHPYLKDFAARLVRGGLVDRRLIEAHVRCEFERVCELLPPPARGSLEQLAEWAARSDIAERERAVDEFARLMARMEVERERSSNGRD